MTLAELRDTVFGKPDYVAARKKAAEILRRFGITRPPVDPELIAENLGYNVLYVNFSGDVGSEIAGLYDFASKTIYVNHDIAPNRKTFTIAHELGHALLHEDYAKSNRYMALPRRNDYGYDAKPSEEKEADVFAACLLVPKDLLRRYKHLADLDELSALFAVSSDVVHHQLKYI